MSKITIRKDGLYKDNVKMQLILGDPEQVAAIRAYEKRVKQFEDGLYPSSISYKVEGTMFFTCLCDEHLFERTVDAESENDESCFAQEKFECPTCKRTYETEYSYKESNVFIYLKPFTKKNV